MTNPGPFSMHATLPLLVQTDFPSLTRRRAVETLQVNLGYRCNQSCMRCHVNAGPNRKEVMTTGELEGRPIRVADHCYGCTGGQGSSCGGALGNDTDRAQYRIRL
jgi:hypothetical protein